MQTVEYVISRIRETLCACSCIEALVLGGSRATGGADKFSDIDIGIYYNKEKLDYTALNVMAARLDDEGRTNLICREGEWGPWVNCGGWLTVNGYPVDIIMRDMDRVAKVVERADRGEYSVHYQTGHPHAYVDVTYRGELACCNVMFSRGKKFMELKKHAEVYPAALKASLLQFFGFEAGFSCMMAEKSLPQGDGYYVTGHVFRAISALNQALFALNETWLLNEKKAIFRIDGFPLAPLHYAERVNTLFSERPEARGIRMLKGLCEEGRALWEACG